MLNIRRFGKRTIFYIHYNSHVTVKNSFYDNLTSNDNEALNISENNLNGSKYNYLYHYAYLCELYLIRFNNMDPNNDIKCSKNECFKGNYLIQIIKSVFFLFWYFLIDICTVRNKNFIDFFIIFNCNMKSCLSICKYKKHSIWFYYSLYAQVIF